jgi:hypothetical protein
MRGLRVGVLDTRLLDEVFELVIVVQPIVPLLVGLITHGRTSTDQSGYVAVAGHFSIGDFLDGRVDCVEE